MSVTDPVGQGIVEGLAQPGDNITGFALFEPAIGGKWLELLKEMVPSIKHVALLYNRETAPFFKILVSAIEVGGGACVRSGSEQSRGSR